MIGDAYKEQAYDPTNAYSVPTMCGTVGLIYNTTMVEEATTSWAALWDERYKNNILMFDNSRDAFGIALKKLGLSLNPSSPTDIDAAAAELMAQKDVVQAYVMDQIFDKMEGGEAALAPYYAGDAITMIEANPDLAFAIPSEGTNYFVDSMCIPKGAAHREAAEMYINFLCEPQVSLANCLYIGYSTPNVETEALLPEDVRTNPIAYPPEDVLANTETFAVLSDVMSRAMDDAWSRMRGGSEEGGGWMIPVALAVAVVLVAGIIVWRKAAQKRRNNY
jgi:spermidine/putrescine transport system substrate-binding protein